MDNRDVISQKYFNQTGITLTVGASIEDDEFDVFNNLGLLARLTGAPDGSHITVSRGSGEQDTEAAGSATNRGMFFGYHVWPALGFDAPLTGQILGRLPQELQECVRLSDLMRTDDGSDWWYDNGITMHLSFDLQDSSVSWQLLNEYAKARGISI